MCAEVKERVYFPILISLSDRKCLVVGGGPIARHKVQSLEKFSPDITILAPEIDPKLEEMAEKNRYTVIRKEYETTDLDGFDLVIAATGKKEVSKQVWQDCRKRGILINAVDDPEHCDFILPATIKRGDLTVSVGTQGKAPFLTKELRRWLNRMFTPEWSEVVELAANFRGRVFEKYPPSQREEREACFARFLEIDWAALLREKAPKELEKLVQAVLEGKKLEVQRPDEPAES